MNKFLLSMLVCSVILGGVFEINATRGRGRPTRCSARIAKQREMEQQKSNVEAEDSEDPEAEAEMTESEVKLLKTGAYFFSVKEFKKAFEIFSQLAKENNNSKAFYLLGLMYKNGLGVEKDMLLAYDHLKAALVAGKCMEAVEEIIEITDEVIEELRLRPHANVDFMSTMYM